MKRYLLRHIYLLFWKNLVLLKRQYIVTACEIVLPTLFCIAIAYIRSQIPSNEYNDGMSGGDYAFTEYGEEEITCSLSNTLYYSYYDENYTTNTFIGYAPKSAKGQRLVEDLVLLANSSCPYYNAYAHVVGFDSEAEMEANQSALWLGNYMGSSDRWPRFAFGVVFDGLHDNSRKISYKIRLSNGYFYDTKNLMPNDFFTGPGYNSDNYRYSSFSGIQLLLDKLLLTELIPDPAKRPNYKLSMQTFPYPEYKSSDLSDLYSIFMPIFIVTGFVFVVPTIVRSVVSERETGIKELLKMSGLPEWMHWFGWMLNSLTVLIITVTVIVIILFVPFKSEAGAVFKHSDPTLLWVLLMLYSIWATTYCFAVSAFFEKPTLGTTAGIVIWLVSFYGLGLASEQSYGQDWSLGVKLLMCLFPNVGINLALKAYCNFEAAEKGAKWSNMADTMSSVDSLTLLWPMLMMIASSVLNMLICLYVEAVLPKKYGVRKPLYFIFQPSEWGFGKKSLNEISKGEDSETTNKPGFEDEPSDIKAGIEIKRLRKEFGHEKVAVNDVTVNIFPGQIFCLLGENGAGKTTTMSMLTGMFAPTSGTAFINGCDIRTDMVKIRENLGLCPQHNMLFDKLTVYEHLKFFAMLKGCSAKEAEVEITNLLQVLQIPEKRNFLSVSLSGGQKRRLSLGCSIIGNSKTIFLDEPTSGMDPEARRAIWDILLRIREDRIIVLTTHFMEEADVLGDRIAIMASGVLQCCGSPSFLKKFYGAGYTLSMTIQHGAKRESILATVRSHIADAFFKVSHSNSETELSIVLPSDKNTSSLFPALFSELTKRQAELQIEDIGVGWTTMDEVFVRVEELSHKEHDIGNIDTSNQASTNLERAKGLQLVASQFYALLMKKILWTIRRKRVVLSQMVIPVVLTIAAVAISRAALSAYSSNDRTPPLKITLSSYKQPVTLYSATSRAKEMGDVYAATVGSSAKLIAPIYNNDVSAAILDVGRDDISFYRERHIIGAEINDTNIKAMFNSVPLHSAPLTMNVLTNAFLRAAAAPGQESVVETINHPFRNTIYELLEPAREDPEFATVVSFIFGVLVPIGMALLVGSFIIMPTDERLCKGKQLQMMTGTNPTLYWGSMYICDYFLMLITVCLMVAMLPIFEKHHMFTNYDGAGVLFLILSLYGFATLSFTYIFSTFVRTIPGGFTLITIVHLVTGIGLGIGANVLENFVPGKGVTKAINVLGRLFPTFGVTKACIHFAKVSSGNSRCSALSQTAKNILCSPSFNVSNYGYYDEISQECCDNCHELGPKKCFVPTPYFEWTRPVYINEYPKPFPVRYDVPSLTQDLVWLALIAVVYVVILVLIEYDVFQMILEKVAKQKSVQFQRTVTDVDVIDESTRISKLVGENRAAEDAVVVDNFCKSYGAFSAVSSLSFGVHHGECFGLLGVNGAGKTTTFRMLTGDENRSSGNSFIDNLSLGRGRKEFLSKLGYCPQFDGIVGVLTGKEMLRLFARLRGISGDAVEQETKRWLKKTGLLESGDVQCQKYSGGMKRRLSAAISLIGDPPVVLLDEPTSGVDPVARRQFWKIVSSIRNSGQAIVLTSHSMEECEALCSRVGIMVNGEMQCLGGVQHLKNKFAQGYSLTLKLKPDLYQNLEMTNRVTQDILNIFNPCSLKDHHQTTMKFQIHTAGNRWEDLYRTMEQIKERNECVDEYAITETTLEEVFLSFARTQYTNERVTTGRTLFSRLTFFC